MAELPILGRGPAFTKAAPPPILSTGFRPFFLLAALSAVCLVPSWLAVLLLGLPLKSWLPPVIWHPHELLFGYTSAVIAGFLLTAAQNWTGQVTARGGWLAALCALWLAGRVVSAVGGSLPAPVASAIDLTFLPALALCVGRPIVRTRNWRNLGLVGLLLGLALANGLLWSAALGAGFTSPAHAQRIALDAIAGLILVIGGRVLPMFTRNATPGLEVRAPGLLDRLGVLAVVALLGLDLTLPDSLAALWAAGLAGALNAARLWGWGGSRTLMRPILSALHVGFACTAAAFALRTLVGASGAIGHSAATHLFTVGGIGLMTLAMMARVALGHTGRPLQLPPGTVLGLRLLAVAAVVRTLGPVLWPAHYNAALFTAGGLWTAAFGLYLVEYARILLTPRPDGRPG